MTRLRPTPNEPLLAALLARGGVVKIDGLREPEHAFAAAEAGADILGFIFAPARRRVTPDQARACIAAARAAAPNRFLAVGVFVDEEPERIVEVVAAAGLDAVQLHGEEPPGFAAGLPVAALKAFNPRPGEDEDEVAALIAAHLAPAGGVAVAIVDGYHPGATGGTGVSADWDLAARLARRLPLLLAGGLTPENVGEAIRQVRPLGVDVSSGVEVDGRKDAARIAAYVAAARAAFATNEVGIPPAPYPFDVLATAAEQDLRAGRTKGVRVYAAEHGASLDDD
jgi:phosphoribosylanthranilate isomerase